jgi:hypothetical protein
MIIGPGYVLASSTISVQRICFVRLDPHFLSGEITDVSFVGSRSA